MGELTKIFSELFEGLIKIKSLFTLNFNKTEKKSYKNSIHQESKNIFSKVSQQVNIQNFDGVPEFHLHLYGSGAKRRIEGHAEKKDSRTLVLESIEIGSTKTKIERQFTKLLPLTDVNYSDSLFTTKEPEINVRVNYRTLDGKKYQLSQTMTQEKRADGLFNVSLNGSPYIKSLSASGNISELEERVLAKLYSDYKETGARTKWRATDAYKKLDIKEGTYLGLLNESKFISIVLDGTHECFMITNDGIRYMDNA